MRGCKDFDSVLEHCLEFKIKITYFPVMLVVVQPCLQGNYIFLAVLNEVNNAFKERLFRCTIKNDEFYKSLKNVINLNTFAHDCTSYTGCAMYKG